MSTAAPVEPERDTRTRLLDAAVRRIAEDGIDGLRIARVATDAGVSSTAIHYHFDTREELLAAALEHSYALVGTSRLPEGEQWAEGSAAAQLRGMVEVCLPEDDERRRDFVLWVELWLRAVRHPELRATSARLYKEMTDWMARVIAEGIASGELEECDPAEVAERAMALIDGYGVRALIGDPAVSIDHARRRIWAAIARDVGLEQELDVRK